MGHCCSKDVSAVNNEVINSIKHPTPPNAAEVEVAPPATNGYANSFAASPFQSPLPAGVRPSPSPARTPGRKFRWPLPPPSPAKPIMAMMRRRVQGKQQPQEGILGILAGLKERKESLKDNLLPSRSFPKLR